MKVCPEASSINLMTLAQHAFRLRMKICRTMQRTHWGQRMLIPKLRPLSLVLFFLLTGSGGIGIDQALTVLFQAV